eukprot:GHRR01032159.1.p1 GENE.GHRR01032159.1~~GHRR01032159.1.p1  ORF type:complete len:269 (+),score=35.77 GHRR01032159.1:974-1780(+)
MTCRPILWLHDLDHRGAYGFIVISSLVLVARRVSQLGLAQPGRPQGPGNEATGSEHSVCTRFNQAAACELQCCARRPTGSFSCCGFLPWGFVVAAVEHADGTACCVQLATGEWKLLQGLGSGAAQEAKCEYRVQECITLAKTLQAMNAGKAQGQQAVSSAGICRQRLRHVWAGMSCACWLLYKTTMHAFTSSVSRATNFLPAYTLLGPQSPVMAVQGHIACMLRAYTCICNVAKHEINLAGRKGCILAAHNLLPAHGFSLSFHTARRC